MTSFISCASILLPRYSGRKEEALKILANLESRHEQNPSANANIALVYLGLGDQDQAMIWLDKAYETRFNPSILLQRRLSILCDPMFNSAICGVGSAFRNEIDDKLN